MDQQSTPLPFFDTNRDKNQGFPQIFELSFQFQLKKFLPVRFFAFRTKQMIQKYPLQPQAKF